MKNLTNKIITILKNYDESKEEVLRTNLEKLQTYFKGGTQLENTQRFFRYYESKILTQI